MTGFDKFTSNTGPEKIARLMSISLCMLVKDICPLYETCKMKASHEKIMGTGQHKCYDKLCKYFDEEIKENDGI